MKRSTVLFSVLLLAVAATASAERARVVPGAEPSPTIGVRPTAEQASPFEELARSLAVALQDREVRELIQREVGRRFDGDWNVLYRDLANRRLADGTTFRGRLAAAAATTAPASTPRSLSAALSRIDAYAAALPKLQVAVPVRFEDWDTESYVPLVAYMPPGVDDDELVEVPAFDAAGALHRLDARIEPAMPVVVVSLNERTDELGFVSAFQEALSCDPETAIDSCDDGGGGGGGSTGGGSSVCDPRTHSYGDKEILYQIKVNNDHEPWTKGSPEIYSTWAFPDGTNVRGRFHMTNVDDEGTWYTIEGHLFYWQSYYGNVFLNAIWEEDGSDFGTVTYSQGGFNYTVQIKDGDDQLGASTISFHDPQCGYYSTGDAEVKFRHAAP